MAKEGDLKKVELKVSVDCCEGCKRKVKKALRSIEGVYKAQIDSCLPKVTVTGNVDAQTLIRKLAKAGKTAETWPSESQKPAKEEKKEVEICTTNVKDKVKDSDAGKKSDNKECKCSASCAAAKCNGNENCNAACISKEEKKKDIKLDGKGATNSGSTPQVTKNISLVPQPGIVHEAGTFGSYTPYCYTIDPTLVQPMYYRVGAIMAPQPFYVQDRYYYELPVSQPPVRSMDPRFTDYFNDENTAGCSIM